MVVVPVVVVVVVVPVVVPIVVPIVVVQVPSPERRHPDALGRGAERGGEVAGDGGGPLPGAGLLHQGLPAQREPGQTGARRRDHGLVQRGRRVAQQPRHACRAQDGIVPVRMAHRLDAFPGEEREGDALRDGEREQQQQRELAREAFRSEPHPRSTSPVNR